jgi:hypothetical protein
MSDKIKGNEMGGSYRTKREIRNAYTIFDEKPGRSRCRRMDTSEQFLKKQDVEMWAVLIWQSTGTSKYEHGTKVSGFVKGADMLTACSTSDYRRLSLFHEV